MMAAMDVMGNPSSVHAEGRAALAIVERARIQVAALVGCLKSEVIFTSGATDAAQVLARLQHGKDVLVEETAHDALTSQSVSCHWIEQPNGPGHTLAMGVANSETGIITPPPQRIDGQWPFGRARADWLVLDVTQAVGKIAFDFARSGADMAILSAHKFGGPKGVGALILRQGLDITPLATGGGQEMGRRAGTENVIGIAGFGAAAQAAAADVANGAWDKIAQFRKILETGIAAASNKTIFVGKDEERLPNTSCMITSGWRGETQVMQMDLAGFAVSAGSACSSGKVKASKVLAAMGYDDMQASCAIRVSLGLDTTEQDITRFIDTWAAKHEKHQARAA